MKLVLAVLALMLVGCEGKHHHSNFPVDQIADSDMQEFLANGRSYVVNLSGNRTLIITAKKSEYRSLYESTDGIEWSGELKQDDDKHVGFDPFNIADKIIDANLVKEITPICEKIIEIDKAYRKNITSFVDDEGNTWVKKPVDNQKTP